MKALLQRVLAAEVTSEGFSTQSIGPGLVVFLGVARDDTEDVAERLARKVVDLRMFDGPTSKFDKSLVEAGGEILVISQFTLFADTSKGKRPSFLAAAPPEHASRLFDCFCEALEKSEAKCVRRGPFGARMIVNVSNLGPFSIPLELEVDRPRQV